VLTGLYRVVRATGDVNRLPRNRPDDGHEFRAA